MTTPISSMMTTQTISIAMDASVAQAEELMRKHQISALPVIDNDEATIIGIISVRDLTRVHAEKRDPNAVHAWEICTYKPLEMAPEDSISDVARMMVGKGVHHVLITEKKHLVGIVSALDFVKKHI